MVIPELPAFDIRRNDLGRNGSDILIENVTVTDMTSLAIIGGNARRAEGSNRAIEGPSRVTMRQISGNYNLDKGKDTVLVRAGSNIRLSDGKFNGSYVNEEEAEVPASAAMIRFEAATVIDTYSIVNWGSQAKGEDDEDAAIPLQKFGFVIDCTHGAIVNGTMNGTNVFDHVSEAGLLITSDHVPGAEPEDVKFGGLVAFGLRCSADTGVSRKVNWQGVGYFRGYVEVGGRLQAAERSMLVITAPENAAFFAPPLFEGCTFRGIAGGGTAIDHAFDIAAPCSLIDCTIENSGQSRIVRLGRVTDTTIWRMIDCDVSDVQDPTIEYFTPGMLSATTSPSLPTARNREAVVTGNTEVIEDSVLDAADAAGPFNLTTARWLRSGSLDSAIASSRARKTIYDTLVQTLYDIGVVDRFGVLALRATHDRELSLHDLLTPSRRFALSREPQFTPDKGWKGVAVSGADAAVLDTGYYPADDPRVRPNDFALLVCCAPPNAGGGANDMDLGAGSACRMSVRATTGNRISARMADTTALLSPTPSADSVGTFMCNRFGGDVTFHDAAGSRGAVTVPGSIDFAHLPLTIGGVGTTTSGRIIRAAGMLSGFNPADTAEMALVDKTIAAFQACFAAIDALPA